MARKDASTLAAWELTPTDIDTIGFRGGSFEDVGKACDRWLQKREIRTVSPFIKFGSMKPFKPEAGTAPVVKKKYIKIRKYASKEERIVALRAKALLQWSSMTPEQKAERVRKNNSLRKQNAERKAKKA